MDDIKRSFDERAKEWDTPSKIKRSKALAKQIVATLPSDKTLKGMELGCGTGLVSMELKDKFEQITLVDTSEGMLDVLKEKILCNRITHFKPILRDVFQEPLAERFNVIYTVMTLHHIEDIQLALTKIYGMLLPGGIFFAADLDKEDGSFHKSWEQVHHGFDRYDLEKLSRESGFTDVTFSTAFVMKKPGNWFFKRKFSIFLMRAVRSKFA